MRRRCVIGCCPCGARGSSGRCSPLGSGAIRRVKSRFVPSMLSLKYVVNLLYIIITTQNVIALMQKSIRFVERCHVVRIAARTQTGFFLLLLLCQSLCAT